MLLLTACILSVAIENEGRRDWISFALLFFLCNVMVWADYLGERSASNAIAVVRKMATPECSVRRDGEWRITAVRELVPGDVIWLKAGVVVPADGVFLPDNKCVAVDESSLTGECLPIKKFRGMEILSGSVVQRGEGEMRVEKTGKESFYGKTIALLANAERKGHLRTILDAAALSITLVAAAFATFVFFWEGFHPKWEQYERPWGVLFQRAFALIAAVIPAAMPVVTTTVLAVGSVAISKENAVVSRLSAIEEAAGVEILCSDKTGTLTLNELTICASETEVQPGFDQDKLLVFASLASTLRDPEALDAVINQHADMQARAAYEVLDYIPFNPVDKRATSLVRCTSGELLCVTKGAPHVIRDLVCAKDSDSELRERIDSIIKQKAAKGLRTLGVAIKSVNLRNEAILETADAEADEMPWQLVGYLSVSDPPRPDTKQTLERARNMGVGVKMLTGDQLAIAVETARLLDIGDNIAGPEIFKERPKNLQSDVAFREYIRSLDGFAGVYPEHKFDIVDTLQQGGLLVAMTGDGVNDAPALKRASVGIAVSGATEAAKAAADIVLLAPGLSSIITVFSLSRQIFKRIESYITFRVHSSLLTLLFWWSSVVLLSYNFPTWILVLVAIINDFVLMSCSRDNVPSPQRPLFWSMIHVCVSAFVTAFLMAVSIFVYIYLSDPTYGVNWFSIFGLSNLQAPADISNHHGPASNQTHAGVWLLLTMCIQLSFHCCRTQGFSFFYNESNLRPSIIVLIPQVLAVCLTLFLSVYWRESWVFSAGPRMVGISWGHAGATILYSIVTFVITDLAKIASNTYISPALESASKSHSINNRTRADDDIQFKGKIHAARREMAQYRRRREEEKTRQRKSLFRKLAVSTSDFDAAEEKSAKVKAKSVIGRASKMYRRKTHTPALAVKRKSFEQRRGGSGCQLPEEGLCS